MLRLPPFELRQPTNAAEAARILAGEGSSARIVAGGTDLWPNMKRRHQTATTVVSLMGVEGLSGVAERGSELRLGSTTSLANVAASARVRERFPALARAVASISSPPLREMGTIGGNICVDTRCTYYNQTEPWRRSIDYCMKEAGEICWVATSSPRCWAHSASDAAPILAALGARIKLVGADGERVLPISSLYQDDGIDYLAKRPEEILTGILLPPEADASREGSRCRQAFWKLRRRGSIDFAVLSAAVALWVDGGGTVDRARIWLGAVRSAPVAAADAESFLVGKKLEDDVLKEAARLARKVATPMDNTDYQAQWRGVMVERYVEAALRDAAGLEARRPEPRHRLLPIVH